MPLTAISTGMVDWVLPVAEMPPKLLEFVANEQADAIAAGNSRSRHAGRKSAGRARR